MKDYNEEYFFLVANSNRFPAFDFTGPDYSSNKLKFFKEVAIDDQTVIPLKFSNPIPPKPELTDIHSMASNRVFSLRVKEALESLHLKNVQFVPATVEDEQGNITGGYYIPHIYNLIRCVDTEKSIYEDDTEDDDFPNYDVEKLVLDNAVLDAIPLQERLVFAPEEAILKRVYHRSVVDKVMALKPDGAAFYQLSTFDERQPFIISALDTILNSD